MPCFLVGYSHAKLLSEAFHVPLVEVSHQQGHIAAALWSAGRLELLDAPFLSWHLSGGTTELLLAEPEGRNVKCTKIGGTTGKHLDALSGEAEKKDKFRVKCENSSFSLSGMQNKVTQYFEQGNSPADTAAFALRCVAGAVYQATEQALKAYPGLPVLFSGGVASNSMLRQWMAPLNPIFAQPQYSTDNAMGVAVLAGRLTEV